jgi:hypothetical protein
MEEPPALFRRPGSISPMAEGGCRRCATRSEWLLLMAKTQRRSKSDIVSQLSTQSRRSNRQLSALLAE